MSCDFKASLIKHFATEHGQFDDEQFTAERLFEEYRKRVFFYEERDGPSPVVGQELRRAVSAHARHQTHSYPSINRMNLVKPLPGASRGHWELVQFVLRAFGRSNSINWISL